MFDLGLPFSSRKDEEAQVERQDSLSHFYFGLLFCGRQWYHGGQRKAYL